MIRLPKEDLQKLHKLRDSLGFKSHRETIKYLMQLHTLISQSCSDNGFQDWLKSNGISGGSWGGLVDILTNQNFDPNAAVQLALDATSDDLIGQLWDEMEKLKTELNSVVDQARSTKDDLSAILGKDKQ